MESTFFLETTDEASVGIVKSLNNIDSSEVIQALIGKKTKYNISFWTISWIPIIILLIFCFIYLYPIYELYPTAHTCLSIIVLCSLLWGTETIPSYITSYLVPLLSIWFSIGYNNETGERIPSNQYAVIISAKFMDPIIFVFLGSMTMSAALTKLQITERVSSFAFSKISNNSKIVLLTIMLLNFITASFLSNIASTTLLLSFSLPIIRTLDPDDLFIKSILFGLAWSGNAGGLPTTISSVQNILAIKYINESGKFNISFFQWITFAGPIGLACLIYFWIYLIIKFPTKSKNLNLESTKKVQFSKWTWKHSFTVFITILTIFLWALQENFPKFLGHVGITSLLPIVSLFSTKILDSDDFSKLRWSTLSLMGGGLA